MAEERTRVLVVDDSAVIRALIVDTLAQDPDIDIMGAVPDGHEAKALIAADCPQIVITDWEMPGLKGPELCRWIRQASLPSYVYVILLTARSRSTEAVEGLEAGADDFVCKPIDGAVLRARVRAGARVVTMERSLRELSESDPLTGVLNRRTLRERFRAEWQRSRRYNRPLSCVMVDLDFFKKINDTHGHAAGDLAIINVARILRDQRRLCDQVSRYGGEEFCVLLPETGERGAAAWAERCRREIAETAIPSGQETLRLTASFGVAQAQDDITTLESLADLADQALAVAKASGRNRVECYSRLNDPLLDMASLEASQGPMQGAAARDAMTPAVVCPNRDDTIRWVTDVFLQLRLSSAPVVDGQGLLVGIVSETDLLAATSHGDGWQRPVGQIMRSQVVSFDEDAPLGQIFQFFSRASVRRVVIVDQGRPTGVVSRAGLLRWFRNWSCAVQTHSPESHEDLAAVSEWKASGMLDLLTETERRSALLRRRLERSSSAPLQEIVCQATRLQEMLDNLLGLCHNTPAS